MLSINNKALPIPGEMEIGLIAVPDAPYLKDQIQEGILKHTSMTDYQPVEGIACGLVFCRVRRRHPFARTM